MNKHQKLVQQQFLNDEEAVIRRLKSVYGQSLKDIQGKAKKLQEDIDDLDALSKLAISDEEKEIILSRKRAKVYQKKYQDALEKQVSGVFDKMQAKQYSTVSDYLTECYENGFVGTMYDLQGQGIPLCFPMDQEQMVRAVQLDSKISEGLYTKLGENIAVLKKKIAAQVSRGISSGMSYQQVAQQLAGTTNIGYNNAIRIARTEGHRIQCQAGMDACHKAKDKGADVVKQWDATMDSSTRESHIAVDGEIRELDDPFSNGLMFPGDPNGGAAEVINCRCALLQRARWALDEEELEALKEKAAFHGIDKSESFEDYKAKYLKAAEQQPEVKPKKEYLTEKKLQQYIDDADAQLANLEDAFKAQSGGWTYDEAIADFGSLEDFTDGDDLKALKALKKQMDDITAQKTDWEEKLTAKKTAKETKKLKKEQMSLQKQLDAFDDSETFGGIWYGQDDITVKDWQSKQGSIQKKIDYYEDHIKNAAAYGHSQADVDKFTDLLAKTKDFDAKGQEYWKVKNSLDNVNKDLTKLQKNGIIGANNPGDAFTQERKDAAYWFTNQNGSTKAADGVLRDKAGEVWKGASGDERSSIYDYTCGSGKFNRPLSGFEKPYSEYGTGWEPKFNKGVKNVWLDFEGAGDEIRHTTNIISRSTYDFDIWLQRGCGGNAMESFLGLSPNTFANMSEAQLQQFVGRSNRIYSFVSTSVSKGNGFSGEVIMNIYAPKGTQMMYAEPFSAFGQGSKLNWNGISKQNSFGYESEMIVQRGASYTITKIEKAHGQIYIDVEVHPEAGYDLFQQDPSEWTGSKKKGR
jgi:uncharacterized protein with gpF-like domain